MGGATVVIRLLLFSSQSELVLLVLALFAHHATDHCDKLGACFPVKGQTSSVQQRQLLQQGSSTNRTTTSSSSGDGGGGGSGRVGGADTLCLPRFFADMGGKEIDALLAQLWALDGRVYGNCQSACWLKQVSPSVLQLGRVYFCVLLGGVMSVLGLAVGAGWEGVRQLLKRMLAKAGTSISPAALLLDSPPYAWC
jgi:hypothetical protein